MRLYAEPQFPELGDYWREGRGWSVYVAGGVIFVSGREAREEDGALIAVAPSLVEMYGSALASR